MDYLDNITKQKKPTTYSWQEKALDMWRKLHIGGNPPATFFKCFKKNERLAESVCLSMSDGTFKNPLTTFFWKFSHVNN